MRSLNLFTVAVFVLAAPLAMAAKPEVKAKPAEVLTPFSKLASEFDTAGPVKLDEIDGYYSGRCFEHVNKSVVLPGLLATVDFSAGPNLPQADQHFAFRFNKYLVPDIWEHHDTDQEKKALIKEVVERPFEVPASTATEKPSGIVYQDYFEGTRSAALETEIRKAGDLFYSRTKTLTGVMAYSRTAGRQLDINSGVVTEYCYYYKQVLSRVDVEKFR